MKELRLRLFFFFILLFSVDSYSDELCSGVYIYGTNPKLTETEERLVCGDKKSIAYKRIPPYEAQVFLTAFLQSRGYLNPKFEIKDDELHADVGRKSVVKKVTVSSENIKENQRVKERLLHLYKRRLLNPDLLNQMEGSAINVLRNEGFPCAKAASQVDSQKDHVYVKLDHLTFFQFGEVDSEKIQGMEKRALERFYPFKEEDLFRGDLLKLTEKRLLRSEVVQGTYFLENCAPNDESFSLEQKFIVGPPRTIRFGAGASTELGPLARVRWSHNRFRPMASQLSANLQASLRSQSLTLTADNYLWKTHPRRSVLALFEILRESQFEYEQLLVRGSTHMKWTRDGWDYHQLYTLGPSYESGTYHSSESINTKSFSTGILEGSLQFMSHEYELFDVNPEAGDLLGFTFDARHPAVGFQDPLLKMDSTYVTLSRITNSGRGTIVGGIRLNAGTAWISDDVGLKSLPPTVKFFGGGSDDNRGFLIKTLPRNDGLGALTRTSLKLELRRTALFRDSIEAFTFLDNSYFGDKSWSIDPRLWYSPGLGFRWLSPIGLVQAYGARALASAPYEDLGNLFYAGFGGTF